MIVKAENSNYPNRPGLYEEDDTNITRPIADVLRYARMHGRFGATVTVDFGSYQVKYSCADDQRVTT